MFFLDREIGFCVIFYIALEKRGQKNSVWSIIPSSGISWAPNRASVDALSRESVFFGADPPPFISPTLVPGRKSRTLPDSGAMADLSFPHMEGCAAHELFHWSPFRAPFVKSQCNFAGAESVIY